MAKIYWSSGSLLRTAFCFFLSTESQKANQTVRFQKKIVLQTFTGGLFKFSTSELFIQKHLTIKFLSFLWLFCTLPTFRWLLDGGLDFDLRFPYKVKIFKMKGSSGTKLFTPRKRTINTKKSDTFPVLRRHTSHKIQPIKSSLRMHSTQNAPSNTNS